MTNRGAENGATRDELVQRVALMEAMIAEGRRSTARYGWVFLLWGTTYFAASLWTIYLPGKGLGWPVCIVVAIVIGGVVRARQRKAQGEGESARSRSIEAAWKTMGAAVTIYVIGAVASHHANDPAYFAAILFFIGLAHGTSATILRWGVQGAVAAVWWGCGIASFFFTTPAESMGIFLAATFFGMILFGLYAMWLEQRRATALVQHHA